MPAPIRPHRWLLPLGALGALAATQCNPTPDQGTVAILTVDDPFVGPPAATELLVQGVAYDDGGADGAVTTLAQGPVSSATLDLGTYDENVAESLVVTATDSAGTIVARGETLPVELGAIAGVTLGVYVQRTGTLSRLPNPVADGRPAPLLSIVGGRYVMVAGGGDSALEEQTELYDLVAWSPLESPPTLPVAPASIAIAQLEALAITSTGAVWFDLTESNSSDAGTPTGTAEQWADVAGGQTIVASDLSKSYVVGGTRSAASGPATATVLVVTASGGLSWANFTTPRLGATAAWVDGLGLVIAGGNVDTGTTGSAAPPGVEYLVDDANGVPLDYPTDTLTGEAMLPLSASGSSTSVLLVGGTSGSSDGSTPRVITVPCGSGSSPACMTTAWTSSLPTPLTFTQAFTIDPASAFVVGEAASGAMHAYRLSSSAVVEVPFRVPRSHARAVRLPIGSPGTGPIAVVGGDPNIESFVP